VKYLLKTCVKFTRGEANLEDVLGSQNYVFSKAGLGYNPTFQKKTKKFSSFSSKSKPNDMSFIYCNYCMQKVMLLRTAMLENMMFLQGL